MRLPTILPEGSSEKKSSSISFYRLGDIAKISKGSLSKLLVPLPPVTEQIALSDKYDKVKTVDFYHRYANPIIEQYDIQSSNVVGKENIRSLMDNWHRLFISKS